MIGRATIIENAAWAAAAPSLSILIPAYKDDPTALIAALDQPDSAIEIVALDDGSRDVALACRIANAVTALATPAKFIRLGANEGRAKGRNRLAAASRGRHLLFLDADMAPDSADFIDRWLTLIGDEDPAVAFGGFSLDQAPADPGHAVSRALALRSDCLSAAQRRRAPEKHVFTSNLLVRRDIFESEPFDGGFTGWGWEDVEWGMRVSRRCQILHTDNTATHLGLEPVSAVAAKYEQSAANFARVVAAHRAIVSAYPSYRVARALKRLPLIRLWRPWLKAAALFEGAPAASRAFALRLYRAALYAEVI
jgi:glycosyltransferase involved in cell wall biosynthesis